MVEAIVHLLMQDLRFRLAALQAMLEVRLNVRVQLPEMQHLRLELRHLEALIQQFDLQLLHVLIQL